MTVLNYDCALAIPLVPVILSALARRIPRMFRSPTL